MNAQRQKFVLWIGLTLIASLAIWLVWFSTPYGMGMNDDSIAYIGGANTLLEGQGYLQAWLPSQRPMTHFPPGFSGTLVLIKLLTGLNPYRAARLLNGVLFGASALLIGWLGWRMTRRLFPSLMLSLLLVLTPGLLRMHTYALSEPLYMFLALTVFHAWFWEGDRGKGLWSFRGPLLAGFLSGLAYLTRYAALALIATFLLLPFFIPISWQERLKRLAVYLLGFLPLPLVWSLRNWLVAGNLTNRMLLWHPVTAEKLFEGVGTLSQLLMPVEAWRLAIFNTRPQIFEGTILVIFAFLIGWLFYRLVFRPQNGTPEAIRLSQGLYAVLYPASLLVSISLFDASTPLNWRILSPLYPPLLFLAASAIAWLEQKSRHTLWPARFVFLLLLGLSLWGTVKTVTQLRLDGQGFASIRWRESYIIKKILRNLPPDVRIYTNEEPVVYFYTGRPANALPTGMAATTRMINLNLAQEIEKVRQQVLEGKAVIALFEYKKAAEEHLLTVQGLPILYDEKRDLLFGQKELLP